MQYIIKFYIVLMIFLLSGCEMYVVHFNPPQVKPYLNKELRFTHPMLLVQSWAPGAFYVKDYLLVSAPKTTTSRQGLYFNSDHKIPSIQDFERDRAHWQTWQGSPLFKQIRIVGIVPPGTLFHLSNVITAPYAPYTVEVTIDSGQYRGTTATYTQPQKLVPLNILKEEH